MSSLKFFVLEPKIPENFGLDGVPFKLPKTLLWTRIMCSSWVNFWKLKCNTSFCRVVEEHDPVNMYPKFKNAKWFRCTLPTYIQMEIKQAHMCSRSPSTKWVLVWCLFFSWTWKSKNVKGMGKHENVTSQSILSMELEKWSQNLTYLRGNRVKASRKAIPFQCSLEWPPSLFLIFQNEKPLVRGTSTYPTEQLIPWEKIQWFTCTFH